jgi:hypothetical protein
MVEKKKWIQKADPKKGSLSKQLGIPEKDRIPIAALEKITKAEKGSKVKIGSKVVTVTPLLKHRAQFALNVKRL